MLGFEHQGIGRSVEQIDPDEVAEKEQRDVDVRRLSRECYASLRTMSSGPRVFGGLVV